MTWRKRQRGAIAASAAVMLGTAIAIASLVIDLGHLYWVRRDLQRTADLASLSAATDLANMNATALRVAAANGFDASAEGRSLSTTGGTYDETARSFTAGGTLARQNAVEVTASATAPYFFVAGSRTVSATAVATRNPVAGFSLASFVARLDTDSTPLYNSLLGGLLGGPVSLDVLSYQGLAAASVSLGDLQGAVGAGTVEGLLDTTLSMAGWLDVAIAALNGRGDPASAQAASVLATLRASAAAPGSLRLGDLVRVDAGNPEAAADAAVNVLQLVTMAAEVANGGGLIKTTPAVAIPGVATVSQAISFVDPPAIAIGPARQDEGGNWLTTAHAGQVRVRLDITLLGTVSGGVAKVPIYIEAGAADGSLTNIECRQPLEDSRVTIDTQSQTLAAYIGGVSDAAMLNHAAPVAVAPAPLVNLVGLVRIDGYASVPLSGPAESLVFNGPFDSDNTQAAADASLGLGGLLNADLQLTPVFFGLPLPLGGILTSLTGLLGGVLGPVLDNLLLDPLLSLLGVRLGSGDVTAFMLNCSAPRLVR